MYPSKDINFNDNINIPTEIWQYLTYHNFQKKKEITLFYNLLTSSSPNDKNPNMIKWEKDLSPNFKWEQWQKALSITSKASSCIEHWDNLQRILNRWNLTPYR